MREMVKNKVNSWRVERISKKALNDEETAVCTYCTRKTKNKYFAQQASENMSFML